MAASGLRRFGFSKYARPRLFSDQLGRCCVYEGAWRREGPATQVLSLDVFRIERASKMIGSRAERKHRFP